MEFSFKNNLIKVGHGFTISCHVVRDGAVDGRQAWGDRGGVVQVCLCPIVKYESWTVGFVDPLGISRIQVGSSACHDVDNRG